MRRPARKIRVPSIDQLFNTSAGNPMRAERANGVDVGADYKLGASSTVGISAFSTHARDFIERLSGLPFENQDRYRFRGAELTGHTAWSRMWTSAARTASRLRECQVSGTILQTRPAASRQCRMEMDASRRSTVRGAVSDTGRQLYNSRGSRSGADERTTATRWWTLDSPRRWQGGSSVRVRRDQCLRSSCSIGAPDCRAKGPTAVVTLEVGETDLRSGMRIQGPGIGPVPDPTPSHDVGTHHMVNDWFVARDGSGWRGSLPSSSPVLSSDLGHRVLLLLACGGDLRCGERAHSSCRCGIPGHSIVLAALPWRSAWHWHPDAFQDALMSTGALGTAWPLDVWRHAGYGSGSPLQSCPCSARSRMSRWAGAQRLAARTAALVIVGGCRTNVLALGSRRH